MNRAKKRHALNGRVILIMIMLSIIVICSVAMIMQYQKKVTYSAKEAELTAARDAEWKRSQDIKDYDAYSKTNEYVEEVAKSKLGLVYEDEIIFREK